jgi:prepilin-type N-terminal cleavage/methylation domain-containing protein
MKQLRELSQRPSRTRGGFTLAEVVIAMAIAAVAVGGIVYGYVMSAQRAEWSAYSLAAQSLAMQRIEQARASKWDPNGYPPVDELVSSNFATGIDILDIPISGTNVVYATNTTAITLISTSPPLKMIRVDCRWMFQKRGAFTNTVVTYRGPDQ